LPLRQTDKVPRACCLSKERVEDVMEIVQIARRLAHEEFVATTRMYSNINSTLPLKHDCPTLGGVTHSMDEGLAAIGTFTPNVNMRTGSSAFGVPE
jgi:trimethylamine--corrinoid protein Co-methyltransferase